MENSVPSTSEACENKLSKAQRMVLKLFGLDQQIQRALVLEARCKAILDQLNKPMELTSKSQLVHATPQQHKIPSLAVMQFQGYEEDDTNPDIIWIVFVDENKSYTLPLQKIALHAIRELTDVQLRQLSAAERVIDFTQIETLH